MAVLEAVRGWEQTAGLPHINDIDKENAPVDTTKDVPGTEVVEEGWTIDELNNEIETLLAADHITLLMEHDEHINAPVETFPAGKHILPSRYNRTINLLPLCTGNFTYRPMKAALVTKSAHGWKASAS